MYHSLQKIKMAQPSDTITLPRFAGTCVACSGSPEVIIVRLDVEADEMGSFVAKKANK